MAFFIKKVSLDASRWGVRELRFLMEANDSQGAVDALIAFFGDNSLDGLNPAIYGGEEVDADGKPIDEPSPGGPE